MQKSDLVSGVILFPQFIQPVQQLFAESGKIQLMEVEDVGSRSAERVQCLEPLQRSYRRRLHRFLPQRKIRHKKCVMFVALH